MIKIPHYETSYFLFSNFSPHRVVYKGVSYPTLEHAFQAQKFLDEKGALFFIELVNILKYQSRIIR